MVDQHDFIKKLEEKAEALVSKTRKYLPHIGRACLVSTFVEDGLRMINQWGEQRDYIGKIKIKRKHLNRNYEGVMGRERTGKNLPFEILQKMLNGY
jgi:hypothetical protein